MKSKHYFAESYGYWLVVKAYSKRTAKAVAKDELSNLKTFRLATDEEIQSYEEQKGKLRTED